MAPQATRTDRVRCLFCRRAQTVHTRQGLWFGCRFCKRRNPGPAISEAVLAPWGAGRKAAAATPGPDGELEVAPAVTPAEDASVTPRKRRPRPVLRSQGGGANRPSSTAQGEPGATQGQQAPRPATASKRDAGLFDRLIWGG